MVSAVSLGAAIVASLVYFYRLEIDYFRRLDERRFEEEQKIQGPSDNQIFDFIIVGAGTAGCLLASRLSKTFTVLLLEEGGPAPSLTVVPAFRTESASVEEINHYYKSVKQKHVSHKVLTLTQGKMLGGSFAHNELIHNRGNSRDYDAWAKLTRDDSWKYKNVLRIYKKLERYTGPFQTTQRGRQGRIPISTGNPPHLPSYKRAATELGLFYGDSNGPQKEGMSPVDSTQDEAGRAVTTCSIFIEPIMGIRETLTVRTYSEVTQINFDKNIAVGVTYKRHGVEFNAAAMKEVILSAGPFGSPLLLWKSGIGPKEMLSKAKIPLVADLPVGKTLQNQPRVTMNVTANNEAEMVTLTLQRDLTDEKFETYLRGGVDGVLSDEGSGPQAFFVSQIAKDAGEGDWPDLQFMRSIANVGSNGRRYVALLVILGRPKAIGAMTLNTEKYLKGERRNSELAIIDFNYLGHKDDKTRLLEGIKKVIKLYDAEAFKKLSIQFLPDGVCSQTLNMNSDAYWECVVERTLTTTRHMVGTCRMGYGGGDKGFVVDTDFKVDGLDKLRIVDSSVMPQLTNANSNAPTILLAQRAAMKIKKDHRKYGRN